ncbi:hypothetical protein PIB30_021081 [Stylosanthes scabra]|uniref:Uncharacterized protein n=1 Tax=Stylosanthes scabra TaxID=79078 RepID=A0ABU6Y5Y1_9FABA|nr:hypothetical protein [Stylosanthes scabra]
MTGVPLDLGDAEAGTSTPPPTSTLVVPTHLPCQRCSFTDTDPCSDPLLDHYRGRRAPPPEPDLMPEGEEEDIALEEELARQAGRVYLCWDGIGIRYARARPGSPGYLRITTSGLCPVQHGTSSRGLVLVGPVEGKILNFFIFYYLALLLIFKPLAKRLREIMHGIRNKEEDFKKLKQVNKQNRASSTGGSLHTRGSTTYEATRVRMALELGRTPTQSEVFARTHTRKEDREWVDKRLSDVSVSLKLDYNSVIHFTFTVSQASVVSVRNRGMFYGMGVVPSHKHPLLCSDPDDDDTASGPPDLREQVTDECSARGFATRLIRVSLFL